MRIFIQAVVQLGCFLFLTLSSPFVFADSLTGSWTGSLKCGVTTYPLRLEVTDEFNARLDFIKSVDGNTITASEKVDVWNQGNDFEIIGYEWIVKPKGWSFNTLRVSLINERTLEGTHENNGCGRVSLVKSKARPTQQYTEAQAQQQIPKKEYYLTGHYTCRGKRTGSYWQFISTGDKSYKINLSTRSHSSAASVRPYNINMINSRAGLQGFASPGNFGIRLYFLKGSKTPVGFFTDNKGVRNESCQKINFQLAAPPVEYWKMFFKAAKNLTPSINDVDDVIAQYRSLPSSKFLPVSSPNSYLAERDRLWSQFTQNYMDSLPTHINALALDTQNDRVNARIQIARMEQPGFPMAVDIPAYYSNALFRNGIPNEPLYFTDMQAACDRANSSSVANSAKGVESFVGLSGSDWNETTGARFSNLLNACATRKLVDPAVVSSATQRIQTWAPHILKKNGSIRNAENEINALFNRIDSSKTGVDTYNRCEQSLSQIDPKNQRYLQRLSKLCLKNARTHFIGYLDQQTRQYESLVVTTENAHNYIDTRNSSSNLSKFAQLTSLSNQFAKFNGTIDRVERRAEQTYVSLLSAYYKQGTKEAYAKLNSGCKQYRSVQSISSACSSFAKQSKGGQSLQQCNQFVAQSKLSRGLSAEKVLYSDGAERQVISLRDLVCRASLEGLNLVFKKKAKTLELVGIDSKSQRKLFEASMIRNNDNSANWFVNSIGRARANTRFINLHHGQLVNCLLGTSGC